MIFTIIKHNERVTASAESAEERVVRGLDLLERVEALLITVIYSLQFTVYTCRPAPSIRSRI